MNESLSLQFAQRLLWSSAPFLQGSLLHLLSQSSLLIELIHCHLACVLAKKVFNLLAIFEHGAHIEWSHAEVFCKIVNIAHNCCIQHWSQCNHLFPDGHFLVYKYISVHFVGYWQSQHNVCFGHFHNTVSRIWLYWSVWGKLFLCSPDKRGMGGLSSGRRLPSACCWTSFLRDCLSHWPAWPGSRCQESFAK